VLQIGVPDGFVEHGSREDNLIAAGLDSVSIKAVVDRFWRRPGMPRAQPAG
jgi:aryl carrier-like protein